MKRYLAKLVFRIVCGEGNHTPQFEDQLRIFYADDEMHAFLKARKTGEAEQEIITPKTANKPVLWKFIDVAELIELPEFSDGLQIFSRTYEIDSAPDFMLLINDNAKRLYENCVNRTFLMN